MKNQKGFTLVELLVVIAIIAVLSAVAVVNLNSARNKGVDAARKANMAGLPAAAELFYDPGLTYLNVCTTAGGDFQTIFAALDANAVENCDDEATAWAAEVNLTTGEFFCVDSTGTVVTLTATKGAATTVCN